MKKTLALVLALVLCLGLLAACSGNKGGGTTPTAAPAPGGATEAPTANTTPIKIGYLGPLTGGVAQYGIAVQNGVKLYVDQLNAAGGINGRQIDLVSYDEEGDATKAITGYNSLLDSGVVAIVGDVTTGPCTAVVAEAYPQDVGEFVVPAIVFAVQVFPDAVVASGIAEIVAERIRKPVAERDIRIRDLLVVGVVLNT